MEVSEVECVAGRGLRGDRYFDFREDYKGQVTFFSAEVFEKLCANFGINDKPAGVLRRNVIVSGVDLLSLIGREFEIQGVRFRGTQHCAPCEWMNIAFAPGAEQFLKDNAGLRARDLERRDDQQSATHDCRSCQSRFKRDRSNIYVDL